jgi:hypothetical protein
VRRPFRAWRDAGRDVSEFKRSEKMPGRAGFKELSVRGRRGEKCSGDERVKRQRHFRMRSVDGEHVPRHNDEEKLWQICNLKYSLRIGT